MKVISDHFCKFCPLKISSIFFLNFDIKLKNCYCYIVSFFSNCSLHLSVFYLSFFLIKTQSVCTSLFRGTSFLDPVHYNQQNKFHIVLIFCPCFASKVVFSQSLNLTQISPIFIAQDFNVALFAQIVFSHSNHFLCNAAH